MKAESKEHYSFKELSDTDCVLDIDLNLTALWHVKSPHGMVICLPLVLFVISARVAPKNF
jgi:hypothetical protein